MIELQKKSLPAHGLKDGVYRVWHKNMCAGFVIEKGRLTRCAPILRERISYWMQHAKRIEYPRAGDCDD